MFYHIGSATRLHFLRSQNKSAATRSFWALTVLAITIELMLAGAFFNVTLPPEWMSYLQRFITNYTPKISGLNLWIRVLRMPIHADHLPRDHPSLIAA